ncbi:MAG: NTP/NDP exchange transporter [Gemmatirosa sp.]
MSAPATAPADPSQPAILRALGVRAGEGRALLWSCTYLFLVLTACYIPRPIRDEMGVARGVENLAWLFTGTLGGMLLLHPLYTWLVARVPRRRFLALTYRFFIANLVVFYALLCAWGGAQGDPARVVWVGRAFFIWVSVFNLFVVSVFWSFMTDMCRPTQSRRLFGVVAVGGTLGSILGSAITAALAGTLGAANLLLVSCLFLELAAWASRGLESREPELAAAARADVAEGEPDRVASATATSDARSAVIGGGIADGVRHVLASPYLLGIAAVMLFFSVSSTFLYFQQTAIAKEAFGADSAGRTRFFADIDLLVNVLTLFAQVFVTGRLLRWLGVGVGLAFLPLVSLIGFAAIGMAPVLSAAWLALASWLGTRYRRMQQGTEPAPHAVLEPSARPA